MPPVDFHILREAGDTARYRYACQLTAQAYDRNEPVFIRTRDTDEARRIDDLLWTFSDGAFIPHEVVKAESPTHPRIAALIGPGEAPTAYRALVINLATELPAQLEDYAQIAEVVDAHPDSKKLARERYKSYRDRGCALKTVDA